MLVQKLQLTVPDSGNPSSREFLYDPTCCGWELSFRTTQAAGSWVMLTATVRDEFENGPASQTIGPFFATVGGKIFIPFSTVSFTGEDLAAGGLGNNSIVDIVARPVGPGENCSSTTVVIGGIDNDIDANATVTENIPRSVQAYQVTSGGASSGFGYRLTYGNPGIFVISEFSVDSGTSTAPSDGGQRWRPITGSPSVLTIANLDAANAGTVFVFYQFDFAKVN